ncbi:hypothetical protein ACJW30_04G089200 [Castanea mollissima]
MFLSKDDLGIMCALYRFPRFSSATLHYEMFNFGKCLIKQSLTIAKYIKRLKLSGLPNNPLWIQLMISLYYISHYAKDRFSINPCEERSSCKPCHYCPLCFQRQNG